MNTTENYWVQLDLQKYVVRQKIGKMSKNPKYRTLQTSALANITAQIRDDLIFFYWSSIVAHQQAMMMLRTAAKANTCTFMKNPSLQNGYLSENFILKRPKTQDNKALHL